MFRDYVSLKCLFPAFLFALQITLYIITIKTF